MSKASEDSSHHTKLSFIMPAYNCESTVEQSVASLYAGNAQADDEVVIVDDASTDRTPDILRKLSVLYSGLRVIRHRINKGGGAARNTAVENAKNDLIFCLDSDNLLEPSSIAPLVEYLHQCNADAAAFGEIRFFVSDPRQASQGWFYRTGEISLADYFASIAVPGASGNYLFSRASWLNAGGYPEFAGAVDTWGFGFRQLVTGSKMVALENTHYLHRHGHESYWIRDARRKPPSVAALQIVLPYLEYFSDDDVEYMLSKDGRSTWFERLDERQIHVKNLEAGRPGIRERMEVTEKPLSGTTRRKIMDLLRRVLRKN